MSVYCNVWMAESNLGGWEPRESTKSCHAEELTWEVYWGVVQKWPLSKRRRKGEWGKKAFSFLFLNKEI